MKKGQRKQGRGLERLVSHLERALGVDSAVEVESPKRLRDRDTGRLREHDVILSIKQGHHSFLIAIECRDRARPVGVPAVEAFQIKCQKTGVDQGIIVSSSGFYNSALSKASQIGIRCLDLENAMSHSWLLTPGLWVHKRRPLKIRIIVNATGAKIQEHGSYALIGEDGTEIANAAIHQAALREFAAQPWNSQGSDNQSCSFTMQPQALYLVDHETGSRIQIGSIDCHIEYAVVKTLQPFQLHSYSDPSSGQTITEAAVADMSSQGISGSFVIVYRPEEGGRVVFVKDQNSRK